MVWLVYIHKKKHRLHFGESFTLKQKEEKDDDNEEEEE